MKEIMEDMNRSENSVTKYLNELEESGLLERRTRNGGMPTMLYLKKLNYAYEV